MQTNLTEGNVLASNKCGEFKLLTYLGNRYWRVEFITTGYITKARKDHILEGVVRDPYHTHQRGVGYIGEGKYKSTGKIYNIWRAMIDRCYGERDKRHTYRDCYVDDRWHNLQVFGQWYDNNHFDGAELDKDILVEGNKCYGPDTCKMVSKKDNVEKAKARFADVLSPEGIKYTIYNITDFCKQHGLQQSNMTHVLKGRRPHHKGWRLNDGS